jgi:pimeloyl-ACP methyl ester carboxylesterase
VQVSARLIPVHQPPSPDGAVLVLHGGATRGEQVMVSPTQLSVLRMIPTARAVARAGGDRLAVFRLLNSYRGWDSTHTPVSDVGWALGRLRKRYGHLSVGLVGHSLGGRAALLAGALEDVDSVVALNPWVYPTDDADLSGRRVLVVHGDEDRVAAPERARTVARRLARRTTVGFITIPGGTHAMLRHGRQFDGYAAEFTGAALLGDDVPVSAPVARVLAGEEWVTL